MKNNNYFRTLLGALLLGSVITACDKFEDDVPPARMTSMQLHNDNFTTLKNQSIQIDVLANDTIGGTATLTFGQPQNGTVQTSNNGGVYYQPDSSFTGTDSFTYTACLGNDCESAMVNILVKNDTTITACTVKAFDDIRSVKKGYYDTLSVMVNDNLCGETAANTTLSIVQMPAHGFANTNTQKQLFYSPDTSFVGTDEVTYRITNSKGTSTAKVIFNVTKTPQNCHIIARTDSAHIQRHPGQTDTVSVKLLANDQLCLGTVATSAQLLTQNTNYGTAVLVGTMPNMRLIYTTYAGRNFTDIIPYRICRGGSCSTANVYIYVH